MKLTLYTFVLLALVSCAHAPTATVNREPQAVADLDTIKERKLGELRSQGQHYYKRGDYLRAIPYLESLVHQADTLLKATDCFVLGYSLLSIGEGARAEEAVKKGIRLSPYQPVAYQLLGLSALTQDKPIQAGEHFKRGLEFDSHPPKLHYYYGLALEKQGKLKERDREFLNAEEEYEKILLQNVYDFGANFELAYLYLTLGHKIPKVEELIENARLGLKEADPELVEDGTLYAQFYLPMLQGMEAFRKNEYQKASALLEQTALTSPLGAKAELAEIFKYLGAAEKEVGKTELSASYSEIAKGLDPFALNLAPREIHSQKIQQP